MTQQVIEQGGPAVTYSRQFDADKLKVVKDVVASGTTDLEFEFFGEVCKRTGLDPFAKQIYCIKRAGKMTIQTGIDGYRAIAERSGKYAGQTAPQWCGPDGVWREVWLDMEHPPNAARVGVMRRDFDAPVWGVAHYVEYVQVTDGGRPNSMWARMPANQLQKCAEANALRKAFPQELGGIYTEDEMAQAENSDADLRASRLALAQAAAPKPVIPAPPPECSLLDQVTKEFRTVDKFGRLTMFGDLKARIVAVAGHEADYYRILGKHGVEKSDQFKSMGPAIACFRELWQYALDIEVANAPKDEVLDLPFDVEPSDAQ